MNFRLRDLVELDVVELNIEGQILVMAVAPLKDFGFPLSELLDAEVLDGPSMWGMLHSYKHIIEEMLISGKLPFLHPNDRILEIVFRCEQFGGTYSEFFRLELDAFDVLDDALCSSTNKVDWAKEGF